MMKVVDRLLSFIDSPPDNLACGYIVLDQHEECLAQKIAETLNMVRPSNFFYSDHFVWGMSEDDSEELSMVYLQTGTGRGFATPPPITATPSKKSFAEEVENDTYTEEPHVFYMTEIDSPIAAALERDLSERPYSCSLCVDHYGNLQRLWVVYTSISRSTPSDIPTVLSKENAKIH